MKNLTAAAIALTLGVGLSACSNSVEVESSVKKNSKGFVEISCQQNFKVTEISQTLISPRINELAGQACRGNFKTGKKTISSKTRNPGPDWIAVESSFTCSDGLQADLDMSAAELCSFILRPSGQPLKDVL